MQRHNAGQNVPAPDGHSNSVLIRVKPVDADGGSKKSSTGNHAYRIYLNTFKRLHDFIRTFMKMVLIYKKYK